MKTSVRLLILLASLTGCVKEDTDPAAGNSPPVAPPPQESRESQMARTSPQPSPQPDTDGAPSSLVPDANEPAEALAQYQEARRLIIAGDRDQARSLLEQGTARFPESRQLHQQYSDLLWDLSNGTDPDLLKKSGQEAARALEIGLRSGSVDDQLTNRLAEALGRTGDRETFERIFQQALGRHPSPAVHLHYARGLSLLGDPRAEEAFREAVQLQPSGDAVAGYGEWLLDHGRYQEVLDRFPSSTPLQYVHFLRGVALEKLQRADEARQEYDQFRGSSATSPAPARFKIEGSQAQAGIQFEETGRS
jgi:tetratricopeptide (TPR) repeat protein